MSFFDSLLKTIVPPKQIVHIDGAGDFDLQIVGESHYQDELEKITGGKTEDGHRMEVEAMLIHDDDNPYDNKAIKVCIEGSLVGHLSQELAREFRNRMDEAGYPGMSAVCNALIVGGWYRGGGDEGHFGVRLDLPIYQLF